MEYKSLGRSGLKVSRIALGCMAFGEPDRGEYPWSLPAEEARPIIRSALESGINLFDTSNFYSAGSCEEIVGDALKDFARRDEVVISAKVGPPMWDGPNGQGLSRKHLTAELENQLRRLRTDYIDLYQLSRWDPTVPIEETLETMDCFVRSGKVRYIGCGSMYAWQFSKIVHTARANGWAVPISMQSQVNMLYREEEREMLAFCEAEGIGAIPWSPLARGRLTRPWRDTDDPEASIRQKEDFRGNALFAMSKALDRPVVDALTRVSERLGVPHAQVALAWLLHKPVITAPLVGASRIGHLSDAIAALSVSLDAETMDELERDYRPHAVVGF